MVEAAVHHNSDFLLPDTDMRPHREKSELAPAPRISTSEELRNGSLVRSQRTLSAQQEQFYLY
jgi:hypothetical protein